MGGGLRVNINGGEDQGGEPTGEFEALQRDDGLWRWRYVSPNGAEYLGADWYKSKSSALKAGRAWLTKKQKRR